MKVLTFADLTSAMVSELNRSTFDSITIEKIWIGPDEARELLGLEECSRDESPHFVYKAKRYIMRHSRTNRPISVPHCVKMAKEIVLPGLYSLNGETMIFSALGEALSCQHRLLAIILAGMLNFSGKVPVILVRGVADEFADTVDTGRSRTQADNFARRPDILDSSQLKNWEGQEYGNEASKIRKKLVGDLTTVCNLLAMRSQGKNVHASGKPALGLLHHVYRAFESDNGNQLDQLIQLAYNHDSILGSGTTWSAIVSRPMVVTALVLWQLRDSQPWTVDSGELLVPEPPTIDLDECKAKLSLLMRGIADLAEPSSNESFLLSDLIHASGKKLTGEGKIKRGKSGGLDRNYTFEALVQWLQREHGGKSFVGKLGSVSNAKYTSFGGVDVGYIETRKAKSEE